LLNNSESQDILKKASRLRCFFYCIILSRDSVYAGHPAFLLYENALPTLYFLYLFLIFLKNRSFGEHMFKTIIIFTPDKFINKELKSLISKFKTRKKN